MILDCIHLLVLGGTYEPRTPVFLDMLHTGGESCLETLSGSRRGEPVCFVHAIPVKLHDCVHKSMDLIRSAGLIISAFRSLKAP